MSTPASPDPSKPDTSGAAALRDTAAKPTPEPRPVKPAQPEPDTGARAEPGKDAGVDELVSDIERTRGELGDTVDALSEKFDVQKRAQHVTNDVKRRATEHAHAAQVRGDWLLVRAKDALKDDEGSLKPAVPAGAALLAIVLIALGIHARKRGASSA